MILGMKLVGAVIVQQVANLLRTNRNDEGQWFSLLIGFIVFHLYVTENGFITFIKKGILTVYREYDCKHTQENAYREVQLDFCYIVPVIWSNG